MRHIVCVAAKQQFCFSLQKPRKKRTEYGLFRSYNLDYLHRVTVKLHHNDV